MTLAALPLRILPPQVLTARRPQRMLERMWVVTRSGAWTVVVTGFFEPLFYLLSIRVGFGELIGDVEYAGRTIPYADFVAPALFAASAMNGSIYEATNIFFRLKYDHVYESVLMTPLTSGDVALGEMLYATIRGSLYSVAFLATMWALGMTGFVVGDRDARGGSVDLVLVQRHRHRRGDVHAVVRRLRVRAVDHAADVPVLGHVLSGVELRRLGLAGPAQPALPRRRGGTRPEPGRVVVDLHPAPRSAWWRWRW